MSRNIYISPVDESTNIENGTVLRAVSKENPNVVRHFVYSGRNPEYVGQLLVSAYSKPGVVPTMCTCDDVNTLDSLQWTIGIPTLPNLSIRFDAYNLFRCSSLDTSPGSPSPSPSYPKTGGKRRSKKEMNKRKRSNKKRRTNKRRTNKRRTNKRRRTSRRR
jgi:hypothetical protein